MLLFCEKTTENGKLMTTIKSNRIYQYATEFVMFYNGKFHVLTYIEKEYEKYIGCSLYYID